jgi:ribosomal protein S18 acetylase RimI-like enzyme
MITQINRSIRQAHENDRTQLTSLIQLEPYVHRHLDWRPPLDWLGHQPYLVLQQKDQLVAALACPPDPPKVAWIRTFAAASTVSTNRAWELLWSEVRTKFQGNPDISVAAIPLYNWFRKILERSGFSHTHDVVLLARERKPLPPEGRAHPAKIRGMTADDLPGVAAVDNAAFRPLWRNSLETLRLAYDQAACATVAVDEQGVVGYQLTTPSPHGWHLARLAVHPRRQRRGIAYDLTRSLLGHFLERGTDQISVNTQDDNLSSLNLYDKAGFYRTGEEYPVFRYDFT